MATVEKIKATRAEVMDLALLKEVQKELGINKFGISILDWRFGPANWKGWR